MPLNSSLTLLLPRASHPGVFQVGMDAQSKMDRKFTKLQSHSCLVGRSATRACAMKRTRIMNSVAWRGMPWSLALSPSPTFPHLMPALTFFYLHTLASIRGWFSCLFLCLLFFPLLILSCFPHIGCESLSSFLPHPPHLILFIALSSSSSASAHIISSSHSLASIIHYCVHWLHTN